MAAQLRTPEGKIAILDFGMMTTIPLERRIALVEYIAHLSMKDWTAVAYDLSALGFVPPGETLLHLLRPALAALRSLTSCLASCTNSRCPRHGAQVRVGAL